jgi:CheY-like chemotaxis protein
MPREMHVNLPKVLLVDDEKEVADAYALRLEGVADVTIAYSGEEALSTVDPSSPPDVVLLDRHMPGQSGDEVLEELRRRDLRTRVVMVTAIDPGLEILDLPFDDYLCKPVEREDVRAAVDQQCQVLAYALLGEYFRLESRRAVIEAELPPERLADHDEFGDLDRRTDALRERASRLLPEASDMLAAFSGIDRTGYR